MSNPQILTVAESNASQFRSDFLPWLRENLAIFQRFCQEADAIAARGREHYSARTIGEYLRHETELRDNSPWKINDHAWPDIARLYMMVFPHREGFFSLRRTIQRTPRSQR